MDVLVLEDDSSLRFALIQFLDEIGHKTFAAADMPEALEILKRETPDLLLLDLMIGPKDSLPLADLAGYRCPDAEIIYMTGSNKFPNGELFTFAKNVSWVLRKPIDFVELGAMLTHIEASCPKDLGPPRPTERKIELVFFNRG